MGELLLMLSKYLVMYGVVGCRVWVGITVANSGLASTCSFCPSSLVLSSSLLSQSEVANLLGHSFPNWVNMVQYLGSSLVCVEAVGEGGSGQGWITVHSLISSHWGQTWWCLACHIYSFLGKISSWFWLPVQLTDGGCWKFLYIHFPRSSQIASIRFWGKLH